MIHNLEYKGMTRLPSDHKSFSGELEEVYNMVNKNGELRPVVPPNAIGYLPGKFVFVHKTASFEHFIVNQNGEIRAYQFENGVISSSYLSVANLNNTELIKIEAIGNTLVIVSSEEIQYSLFKEGRYIYLGTKIPFPIIKFTLEDIAPAGSSGKPITLPDDTYDADFKLLRTTKGHNPSAPPGYSYTGRQSAGSRNHTPRAPGGPGGELDPDYTYATTGRIISEAFQNNVIGKINQALSDLEEQNLFVFPFFVRYAIRLYDGSLTNHSQPFLMLPTKFSPFQAGISNTVSDRRVFAYFPTASKLNYTIDPTSLGNFGDLVEAVDIFISDPIYTYIYGGVINGSMENPKYESTSTLTPELLFGGIYKLRRDIMSEISSIRNFYRIDTIQLDAIAQGVTNKRVKIDNMGAILNQEPMDDDYLTHDTIRAEGSFSYNNRLHLTGVTRTKFRGFGYGESITFYDRNKAAQIEVGPQPFLYYPGSASEVTIVKGFSQKSFSLQPHPNLNGSFYLDPELENVDVSGDGQSYINPNSVYLQEVIVDERNKMYVSTMFNPFHFPVDSRLTLPVGRIVAVSSNTQAISSGQFGQFPLYAFTDDGIWALEVDQQGRYVARQAVSREVCINPSILQMDSHVGFITAKGVAILSGADNECISDIISDNNTRASKIDIEPLTTALSSSFLEGVYNTADIEEFLKNCELGYEYINGNGRIFVINPLFTYAYVFDILSKGWSKVQSNYKNIVNNYPDCYTQNADGVVVNLSTIGTSKAPIRAMIMSRPITAEDNLFSIKALVHRGIFNSTLNTAIYGSRDGINYSLVTSSKKFHLRAIGSPFRFYKYVTIASLAPSESLSGVHLHLEARYENRLR